MANKLFYPALFHTAEEGGFWISFPDFPECLTEGDNMEEAYEMAVEALGLCISDREKEKLPLPKATFPLKADAQKDAIIVIIEFDMEAYKKKHSAKAVKKTLSIPEWLNEEAIRRGVNFSQVLQEALIQKITS
ncbi:MAG: type II toxin-antitoxin system HicB family antitoxin [Lachnospiraceae bacterium]|nr:type II toxin-antitoxin system HicB family antitoxin [Lachnospiraceae bacterium]